MREIKQIILHCSDSDFGDKALITEWHIARGFKTIGYHFVVLNGRPSFESKYNKSLDGSIEEGRPLNQKGAHCKGSNADSVGICLIGKKDFTDLQYEKLNALITGLRKRFGNIPVRGHYEMPTGKEQGKTCPNIDMEDYRDLYNF